MRFLAMLFMVVSLNALYTKLGGATCLTHVGTEGSAKARTVDALNDHIAWGMEFVTPEIARAFYRHCGYAAQLT
jgi:hypothetical protein